MTTSTAQRIGYLRVSSADQTTARQLDGVHLDVVFEDKASGATTDRPQLRAALKHLRAGDTLVVHSMDRLARNLVDLQAMVQDLTSKGRRVEFVKENMSFEPGRDPRGMLMLQLLGAVAEFERAMIRERQREGIEKAKERGVYKGRAPRATGEKRAQIVAEALAPGAVKAQVAARHNITRETLYQYIRAEAAA